MNIQQNLKISSSQTNPNQFPSRITIIDQISPIKEIIPQYLNRPSHNQSKSALREKPQLITTKSQPDIKCQSDLVQKQPIKAKNVKEPKNNIAQAISLLDSLKLKYDSVLESKIETIISILRAQVFNKENDNPILEQQQQINSLQQINKTLQNELQYNKTQISELMSMNNELNNQIKHLSQMNHDLQNQNFELTQQLKLRKEQKQRNSIQPSQFSQQQHSLIYPQFQYDQGVNQQNKAQMDLIQKLEQKDKIYYQYQDVSTSRNDKDLSFKIENKKLLLKQPEVTHQQLKFLRNQEYN